MVVVTESEEEANIRILTGYDISGNNPRQMWELSLAVDRELGTPFDFWGEYLVYEGRVVDGNTGDIVSSPWDREDHVTITRGVDYAIACAPGGECAGYDLDFKKLWSIPFEGTAVSMSVENNGEYFALMYSLNTSDSQAQMINVRSGEATHIQRTLDSVQALVPLADAWLTYRQFEPTLVALDGTVEDVVAPPGSPNTRRLLITPGTGSTKEDFRMMYSPSEEPTGNQIVGEFNDETCVFTVNGNRVDLTAEGTEDACDTPVSFAAASPDGSVVAALVMPVGASIEYTLINANTGAVLWRQPLGDGVQVARSDLLVASLDASITGWMPMQ